MDFEYIIREYGYLALLIGTFLEGETIVIIAGVMAAEGLLELKPLILAAFTGTFISDQLFFYFGRWKGREFIAKRPKWQARSDRLKPILEKYKNYIILGFRFFYGLRNVTPLVLGSSGISPLRYLILNFLGAAIWAISFGSAGYLLGHAIQRYLDRFHQYQWFVYGGIAAIAGFFWIRRTIRKRRIEAQISLQKSASAQPIASASDSP